MEKNGKFLKMDIPEFEAWLDSQHVARHIERLQVHHTFIPAAEHFKAGNHFKLMRGMEASHLDRGFAEIAQNLTTFPDGAVVVGRSFERIPAGIKGANDRSLCIEHVGNFDAQKDTMTAAHRQAIVAVYALLCRKFSIVPSTDTILYHHWFDLDSGRRTNGTGSTKSCPGTGFFGGNSPADAEAGFLPLVRARLGGAPPPNPTAGLRKARVTASGLRVREAPNPLAARVGLLTERTVVQIYAVDGGWAQVHPTRSMWVSARYLEEI